MMSLAVLIVAAGKGERAGLALPKQFEILGGRAMLRRTVEAFGDFPTQVVIGAGQSEHAQEALKGLNLPAFVTGGKTRQDSVRLGLQALKPDAPRFVLIHDAARPLVSAKIIAEVVRALEDGADGVVPMLKASDTLRRRHDDGHWSLVERDNLYRAQTPQGFVYAKILAAHERFADQEATDDVALAEFAGMKVQMVEGEEQNIKLTHKKDFDLAEKLIGLSDVRTATGYDVHRFAAGDHLWLCGVRISHTRSLEGHSDADAGLHAITDALLGCIGEGDIGQHFPPSEARWRGAPSWMFLDHACSLVRAKGGTVTHIDVTLICEEPKIGPHRKAMRERIAEILRIDVARVSVKATTTEGLGFTGRREGLAAQAIATVKFC